MYTRLASVYRLMRQNVMPTVSPAFSEFARLIFKTVFCMGLILYLLANSSCTPFPRFTSNRYALEPAVSQAPPDPIPGVDSSTVIETINKEAPHNDFQIDTLRGKNGAPVSIADTTPVRSSWEIAFDKKSQPATRSDSVVGFKERGIAVWYGPGFEGKKTASGERFDIKKFTAAHKTLPFNTKVKVTNLDNGASVIVRITDRGPFGKNRIIDLSPPAAHQIGLDKSGSANALVESLQ
jgi:rare lipoprotein A (peptidoglycan hydrolase)